MGLSLKKSPSFQELIQMKLSQSGDDTKSVKKESFGFGIGTVEKLKASNFPATVLRIGQWEVRVFKFWVFIGVFMDFVLESEFGFCFVV